MGYEKMKMLLERTHIEPFSLLTNTIPLFVLLGGLGLPSVNAQGAECAHENEDGNEQDLRIGSEWAIRTNDVAITRAYEILGVSDARELKVRATLTTLAEDNTPFLSTQIKGSPIWHVVVDNLMIRLERYAGEEDRHTRTFDVFLDAAGGQLLKAVSRWPKGIPAIAPEPSSKSAEEQMRRAGEERYHSFPKDGPGITLLEALNALNDTENPLVAKQIRAVYVMWSQVGKWRTPRPVWAITLRGIPPISGTNPAIGINLRNHIRYIVDPKTRKWLCASTSPQPDSDRTE